jgi:hypothetical protein
VKVLNVTTCGGLEERIDALLQDSGVAASILLGNEIPAAADSGSEMTPVETYERSTFYESLYELTVTSEIGDTIALRADVRGGPHSSWVAAGDSVLRHLELCNGV